MVKSTPTQPKFQHKSAPRSEHGNVEHPPFLDKLAQVRKGEDKPLKDNKLQKRAQAKSFSLPLIEALATLKNSPLQSAYERSIGCCSIVEVRQGVATSRYCNGRWCLVCNRIRTAKLLNGYEPILKPFKDPIFLTLSAPSVNAESLCGEISRYQSAIRKVHDTLRKRDIKPESLRKLECTWNKEKNTYHLHYHIIVNGWGDAEAMLTEWMKRNPKANRGGQDIRKADSGSIKELFKYFTKITTKGVEGAEVYPIKVLDVIFTAMRGRRVYQPTNIRKHISEEVEEIQSEKVEEVVSDGYYLWLSQDWVNFGTGEVLSGHTTSNELRKLVATIQKE